MHRQHANRNGRRLPLLTPPVFVTGALMNRPWKNRQMIMVWISFPAPAPKANMAPINVGIRTAGLRPYTSLSGAKSRGPAPNPMRNREVPSVLTSVATWNSFEIGTVEAEKMLDDRVAANVVRPYSTVVMTFFLKGQLMGRYLER